MRRRLLIMGAGTGTANNLMRSLRAGDPTLALLGCHDDRFVLKQSLAERNHLIPPATHPGFAGALRQLVARQRVDLVLPATDADVRAVGRARRDLACRVFLPRERVIRLCQDKYALAAFLRARGVPAPRTCAVSGLQDLGRIFRRLAPAPLLWCRPRSGSGSAGATAVRTPLQARHWIRYWDEMRGIPAARFTLSEYLPGRDFSCQGLWQRGALVLVKTFERLSYCVGGGEASGVSSVAALARTVRAPGVAEVCAAAIRAIDPAASGVFCFDVKEDRGGRPAVTEINAGRFSMSTNLYDLTGRHNMATTYVRLAFDEPPDVGQPYDVAEDFYLVRGLDTTPGVFPAEAFFRGIEEARAGPGRSNVSSPRQRRT